jgi:hypothetical protein
MTSLWFVVPAHGRERLTGICLRQLRRTCGLLTAEGVHATAVVIADDANLDTALELGFATVDRNNHYLARRFNDGIQLACDPRYNPQPADYVVPCGSDDWVDHRLFLDLPPPNMMVGFPRLAVVREDGRELAVRDLNYPGGAGIRIYPRQVMEPVGYRPADEDRKRGCDTSILTHLRAHHGDNLRIQHRHLHDYQLVDWKSPREQLNGSTELRIHRAVGTGDPFELLADYYPADALAEMQEHYAMLREMVAA